MPIERSTMSARRRVAAADVAQHRAQRHEGLVDQGQAERLDRVEVAVERGRHDADLLGHLAQRERAQAGLVRRARAPRRGSRAGCAPCARRGSPGARSARHAAMRVGGRYASGAPGCARGSRDRVEGAAVLAGPAPREDDRMNDHLEPRRDPQGRRAGHRGGGGDHRRSGDRSWPVPSATSPGRGGFATELFEIRDSVRRAYGDRGARVLGRGLRPAVLVTGRRVDLRRRGRRIRSIEGNPCPAR